MQCFNWVNFNAQIHESIFMISRWYDVFFFLVEILMELLEDLKDTNGNIQDWGYFVVSPCYSWSHVICDQKDGNVISLYVCLCFSSMVTSLWNWISFLGLFFMRMWRVFMSFFKEERESCPILPFLGGTKNCNVCPIVQKNGDIVYL